MKRFLSAILSFCMMISMVPSATMSANAAESTEIVTTEATTEVQQVTAAATQAQTETIPTEETVEQQTTISAEETQESTMPTEEAQENTEACIWEYEICADGIILTAYTGTAADVYVPSTVDDHTVIKLGDGLFRDNDALNSVTLGTGILEIGEQAFYDCDNLVCILISEELTTIGSEAFYSCDVFNSIILYDTVTTIGENAFSECPSLTIWCNESTSSYAYATDNNIPYEILNPDATPETYVQDGITYYIMNGEAIAIDFDESTTEVTIPAIVEGYPVTELRETFREYKLLESVMLPDTLSVIGDYAFYNCVGLTSVTVPDGVTSVGDKAFYKCVNLICILLPESLIDIGNYAFINCDSLTTVNLPKNLISIGDSAFSSCEKLTIINMPENLISIGDSAFFRCSCLISIVLPDSVTYIGDAAFSNCTSLTSIALPCNLTSIGAHSFFYCTSLTSIDLPDCVNKIGAFAFSGCTALRTAVVPANVKTMYAQPFDDTTIMLVYKDSYAHIFATRNDCLFFVYDGSNAPAIYDIDGVSYYVTNGSAVAYDCDDSVTDAVVLAEVGGYPVTELYKTFQNCRNLINVTIPDTVTSISSETFYWCDSLVRVKLPDGLLSLGTATFFYCTSLISVELPDGLTSINGEAFYKCSNLKSINFPDCLTYIGGYAFSFCGGLTSVDLPAGLNFVGDYAFYFCSGLTSVDLPDGVTNIGEGTFLGCSSLTNVNLPDGLTSIEEYAFNECSNITEVAIPDSVLSIGDYAFDGCTSLRMVLIPTSVQLIGTNSFDVSTILCVYENSYAHAYSVDNGFMYFIFDGSNVPEICDIDGVSYYVCNGSAVAFDCDDSIADLVVPMEVCGCPVVELGEAFRDCTNLKSITIPETVTSISSGAFYNCTNLERISLPAGLTSIGDYAFYFCNFTSIDLPDGLTSIGDGAFYWCSRLQSVKIPDSLISMGSSVFYNCSRLSCVDLPDNLSSIGARTFYSCGNLTHIDLPDNLTSIESEAFYWCDNLISVEIPEGVTSIGKDAFYNCTSLASVDFPRSLTSIKSGAFTFCTGLTNIDLPDSVTDITGGFSYCTSLTNINFPGNLTSIGNGTFRGCNRLTDVIIPDSIQTIGNMAFDECTALRTVIIPESVTSMDLESFDASTILLVYADSYAHSFAVENNLLYFVLRRTENPEISYGAGISGVVSYTDGAVATDATVEILYNDGTVKETVTTDATGAYAFTYAEVGQYIIRVTDASGNSASTQVSVKRMNVFDVFLSGDTNLTLKKGWTVNGTVSDSTATVTITDENGNVLDSVESVDGSFAFDNIPNGTYIVKAETENGTVTQEITVFDGAVSDITLTVVSENVTVWGYVEVEDREYNHHRRNWVQVSIYNAEGVVVAQTKSDKDGMYRFEKLPVGHYSIVAETAEMRPDKKHHYDRRHSLTGYAYVDASAAGEYQADTIVLYEENDSLATISGKVTAQGESQACQVVLRNVFRHEVAQQTTGKNGKYSFTNVRDGLYFITAITESNGMGYTVVAVRNGKVHGETDITIRKADKIKDREDRFHKDFDSCHDRDTALKHKDRIVEEKRFYDGLSDKEKKQLSREYVDHLNRMCEWIAECEYVTDEGVTVEQGGLVISGDELENEDTVTFEINVEKTDAWTANTEGVKEDKDFIYHDMHDKAGKGQIKQYYEISMTKTVDGQTKQITSVTKDTDSTGKFRITMEIPEEYRGHKHYTMLHVHNGETVTLADLDDDPNTITFEVDGFSTFALTGTDEILVPVANAEIWQDTQLYGNYTTLEEAVTAYDSTTQYVKLTQDAEVTLSLTQDLYIDLNGYTLTGTIISNGYMIYGMDSTTNSYTCDTMGYFNCTDADGSAIVPEKLVKTTTEMTGNVLRYMTVETESGYTFHRFYLGITHTSLKPSVTGVGYQALFCGDDMVKAQLDADNAFGYTMQLDGFRSVSVYKGADHFVSGKTVTLRINNYDAQNFGETPLHAFVNMKLADGTLIESALYTVTLRQLVESVNESYTSYTETQLAAVISMIEKNSIMQSWNVSNLYSEESAE